MQTQQSRASIRGLPVRRSRRPVPTTNGRITLAGQDQRESAQAHRRRHGARHPPYQLETPPDLPFEILHRRHFGNADVDSLRLNRSVQTVVHQPQRALADAFRPDTGVVGHYDELNLSHLPMVYAGNLAVPFGGPLPELRFQQREDAPEIDVLLE